MSGSAFLRNFQISWPKPTNYRSFPQLYKNKLTILQYQLPGLINNAVSQSIDHNFTNKNSNNLLRSSVSCTKPGHSETHRAVRRWQIPNTRELSKASSRILNSVLHLIAVHYINMNRKEAKLKGMSEIRFGSMIFFFRMAGIPLKMKKISIIYGVYMITVIVCTCSVFIGMFADVYIKWEGLGRAMTTMPTLIPFTNIMWIYFYCR